MHSLRRRSKTALCASIAALGLALAAGLWTGSASPAHAASAGQLQHQISSSQGQISALSGAVSAASGQVAALGSSIASLQARITRIQAQLNADRAQLLRLQSELQAARTRLAQLEAFEARAESVLSQQLVSSYESDRPDIVSVVLEAKGLNDLLERLAFASRVRKQSAKVVAQVRSARRAVAAQATRLGALEVKQRALTNQILQQRNDLARTQLSLVGQQVAAAHTRAAKAAALARVRGRVSSLQGQLAQIIASQAASANQGGGAVSAGQVSSGGGFTFPLPKSAASPPGTWSLDQGVDIAAPGGTPELAVCSGTIVLHGIGGFGPWAPVLHCDSSIGGYSYVYYGHAGPANQLPVGTHVGQGQVMSSIGPGIVGISTGPHLEIGFADSSGSPIGGGSASTMMSLLHGTYGG